MENIFDGIQRPLESIYESAGKSPFVPLGVDVPALNRCVCVCLCAVAQLTLYVYCDMHVRALLQWCV